LPDAALPVHDCHGRRRPAVEASPLDISLNFMPAFFTKHAGLSYGEGYYRDPEYRGLVECAESVFLHDVLGRYGVGAAQPRPSATLFIQPIDLIMGTQGAEWRMPPDATLESWGRPWAGLSPAEIAGIDPGEAAHHAVVDGIIEQYRDMVRLYGDRADLLGLKTGTLNIHTPFTTAHALCGEDFLVLLATEPAGARIIMDTVDAIYAAVYGRLAAVVGVEPRRVQLGDCSASLLSEPLYRQAVLPSNRAVAARFPSAGYHSCGPSSHLLPAFADLGPLDAVELGPGTNLALAARSLAGAVLRPLLDPVVMREGGADDAARLVANIITDTRAAPGGELCAWSLDGETPLVNVEAIYETAKEPARGS
jgi:hypothetical protein